MTDARLFPYEEESQSERLARKSKEAPIFPIGMYYTWNGTTVISKQAAVAHVNA